MRSMYLPPTMESLGLDPANDRDNYTPALDTFRGFLARYQAIDAMVRDRAARVVPSVPLDDAADVLRALLDASSDTDYATLLDAIERAGITIDRAGFLDAVGRVLDVEPGTFYRADGSTLRVPRPPADHAINRKRADGTVRGRRAGSIVASDGSTMSYADALDAADVLLFDAETLDAMPADDDTIATWSLIGTDDYAWHQVIHYKPYPGVAPEGAGGSIVGQSAATGSKRKRVRIPGTTVVRYKRGDMVERDGAIIERLDIERTEPARDPSGSIVTVPAVNPDGSPVIVRGIGGIDVQARVQVLRTFRKRGTDGEWIESRKSQRRVKSATRVERIERDAVQVETIEQAALDLADTAIAMHADAMASSGRVTRRYIDATGIITTVTADAKSRQYSVRTTTRRLDASTGKRVTIAERSTARTVDALRAAVITTHARLLDAIYDADEMAFLAQ